jgi:hypothetical protein
VGIPAQQIALACRAGSRAPECQPFAASDPAAKYLVAGRHTVVVKSIEVAGQGSIDGASKNRICSYQGTATPTSLLYFGDPALEQSNQKRALYPGVAGSAGSALLDFNASYGLLNCNYANPSEAGALAATDMAYFSAQFPPPVAAIKGDSLVALRYTENANGCTIAKSEDDPIPARCYEWQGGATLDYFAAGAEPYRTLEFDTFRSFGFDDSNDRVPRADRCAVQVGGVATLQLAAVPGPGARAGTFVELKATLQTDKNTCRLPQFTFSVIAASRPGEEVPLCREWQASDRVVETNNGSSRTVTSRCVWPTRGYASGSYTLRVRLKSEHATTEQSRKDLAFTLTQP